jgi:hypothetical protein
MTVGGGSITSTRIPDSFRRYLIRSGAWMPYLKNSAMRVAEHVYLALIKAGSPLRP